jgi:hypothetical protein
MEPGKAYHYTKQSILEREISKDPSFRNFPSHRNSLAAVGLAAQRKSTVVFL